MGLDGVQDLQDLPAPPLGAGLLGWVGVAQLRGSGKAAGSRRSSIVHSTESNGKAFHGGWAMWSRVAQHRSAPRGKHDVEAAASREHRAKKDADFAPARKQDGAVLGGLRVPLIHHFAAGALKPARSSLVFTVISVTSTRVSVWVRPLATPRCCWGCAGVGSGRGGPRCCCFGGPRQSLPWEDPLASLSEN